MHRLNDESHPWETVLCVIVVDDLGYGISAVGNFAFASINNEEFEALS
jgi:hypothetical protein